MLVDHNFVDIIRILWWSKSIIFIGTHEVSEENIVSYTYQNICIRNTLFYIFQSIKVKLYFVCIYKLSALQPQDDISIQISCSNSSKTYSMGWGG